MYVVTLTYIFKVTKFEISKIYKKVRAGKKMPSYDFIEIDIPHHMGPLWMLYTMTLTYIFMVNIF